MVLTTASASWLTNCTIIDFYDRVDYLIALDYQKLQFFFISLLEKV
jgi:hypothetical protein